MATVFPGDQKSLSLGSGIKRRARQKRQNGGCCQKSQPRGRNGSRERFGRLSLEVGSQPCLEIDSWYCTCCGTEGINFNEVCCPNCGCFKP